jgi:type II secretory pathway predicted ATPase ExeA/cell division protein FtsN
VYEKFFGFQKRPFDLVPDPDFLFLGESHDSALANLMLGIESEKGFIVITGAVGTGKTTILRAVLRRLGRELDVAFLNQPDLDASELLRTILHEFEFPAQSEDKVALRAQLAAFLEKRPQPAILVIDEAHILGEEALEQVRLLSNFEMNDRKLLQIVLAGQPELKQMLSRQRLRPLAQRIEMFYEIQPLSLVESMAYIQRRIQIAGNPDDLVFEPRALEAIYDRTGGVPRLINLLAERTLITAYVAETKRITARMVAEAYADLGEVTQRVMVVSDEENRMEPTSIVFEPAEEPEKAPPQSVRTARDWRRELSDEPRMNPLRRLERWIAGLGIGAVVLIAILSIGNGAFGWRSGQSKNSVSAQETSSEPAEDAKTVAQPSKPSPATSPETSPAKPSGAPAITEEPKVEPPPKSKTLDEDAHAIAQKQQEREEREKLEAGERERLRAEAEQKQIAAAAARVAAAANTRYAIQCGSFRDLDQAKELSERIGSILGKPPRISSVESASGPMHRVLVGSYSSRQEALEELGPLRRSHASMVFQILEIPSERTPSPDPTPSNE